MRQQALALWPAVEKADMSKTALPAELLDRLAATIAIADPNAKSLVEMCGKPHDALKTPEFTWLSDAKTPALVSHNLRLLLGKWLVQERLYDEGLAQLEGLQPADVVDPGSLLFYQSVCYHWMLHKSDGLKTIALLLEQRKTIPHRYEQLATLMQADLNALEDESLDHISRRMNDVTRRLDFGRAGKKVRGEEDGIIASLDKLIKQKEDQAGGGGSGNGQDDQQDDGQGNQGMPNGIRSTSPAADSRAARGTGPGDVTNKKIGNHSGWGNLPPKEREEAMQQIGKEFPSHYRDIIEQYFRKLASEDDDKK